MKLLDVTDLKTYYFTYEGITKAVDGVSFQLNKGEIVGLAGESACGKTTVALSLMKLLPPEAKIVGGEIWFNGENLTSKDEGEMRRIRCKEISIVFQGAMNALNPVRRVGDQIAEAIMEHESVNRYEALERVSELFVKVGIDPKRMEEYPHEFSGGMRQRVMIAMALACNPKLVIADEPTTGLDLMTQAQVLKLIKNLRDEMGVSLMLITHDLSVIAKTCDRAIIMYGGKVVENSDAVSIFTKMFHPYTYLLINAIPTIKGEKRSLRAIPGNPPDLKNPPRGCRFHPRCPYAIELCKRKEPPLREIEKGHYVACHLSEKINFGR